MQTAPQHNQSGILIFDSGVGALSVFEEINRMEPLFRCTLALDNANFPYGTLSDTELSERVISTLGKLIELTKPVLAVVACNTASTLVLNELRQKFDIPFVGVVPAIKPAASISDTNSIGLLATPATVRRSYTENLIEDFAPQAEIIRVGSSELVYMAERKLRGEAIDRAKLTEIMAPFVEHPSLDTMVLACTHFPLLRDELEAILPAHIQILDSGKAIAQRVCSLIKPPPGSVTPKHRLILTCQDRAQSHLQSRLENMGFAEIEVMPH